jgi:hypothetical protein
MILELTRGHIRMQVEGKTVTIACEGYMRGQGSPDFDVYADSIRSWDPPNADVEIDQKTRDRILDLLREEMAKRKLTVEIQ